MKKILIISSANPSVAAGVLAVDYYKALSQSGYEVEFLTKVKNSQYPDFFYISKTAKGSFFNRGLLFLKSKIFNLFKILAKRDYDNLNQRFFFYRKEKKPPVDNKTLLNSLPKGSKYDLIIVVFWQEMLSAVSLEVLYDKYKCPIFIICVDYSPMTGGCHFIANCKTYEKGCGACECWYSKKTEDFTYKNVLEKKRIYEKIKPIFFLNTYMDEQYASKSFVLKNMKKEYLAPVINERLFCPVDKNIAKRKLELDENRKIIFFACQNLNDPRKGGNYVLTALKMFYESLSEAERKKIFLILAGKAEKEIAKSIKFDYKLFGYVNSEKLIQLYQASDVFLSGSVIDAGPMMVNQAMSCGVPVITFNIGTAKDVVNGKNTGYCAKDISAQAFADGIKWWYNLSEEDYFEISNNCRKLAIKMTSYEATVKKIVDVYNEINI